MPIPSETIALPILKGLDVTTDARLLTPPSLLEAENTQFTGGGAKKRQGHTSLKVRGEGSVTLGDSDATWVYGMGVANIHFNGNYAYVARPIGDEDTSYWRAASPA